MLRKIVAVLLPFAVVLLASAFAQDNRGLTVNPSQTEQRIALVIGNGGYADSRLVNPPNDAEAVAAALTELGFSVIKRINSTKRDMKDSVREFGQRIREGGVGLFYFAGHGLQIEGRNFLVPVDAAVTKESEAEFECLDAGFVLAQMEEAHNRLNIIILDACRNNPFARSFRSQSGGLAKMDAPKGSILAYATSPGDVAADGSGKNGLYTESLLKYMRAPGLKIEDLFKSVRVEVVNRSNQRQVPWESSSLMGDFYFSIPVPSRPSTLGRPSPGIAENESHAGPPKSSGQESAWLIRRRKDFEQAQVLDRDTAATREVKTAAWQRFLNAAPGDDRFNIEDEGMRSEARERLVFWQSVQPESSGQAVSPTGKSDLPISFMTDNGDGTVTDTRTRLMWVQKDSLVDLGKYLDWKQAREYVRGLRTGGHDDWRLPTIAELKTIYDDSYDIANGITPSLILHYNPLFAANGAGWCWSSEEKKGFVQRLSFNAGNSTLISRDYGENMGVRAVRAPAR